MKEGLDRELGGFIWIGSPPHAGNVLGGVFHCLQLLLKCVDQENLWTSVKRITFLMDRVGSYLVADLAFRFKPDSGAGNSFPLQQTTSG